MPFGRPTETNHLPQLNLIRCCQVSESVKNLRTNNQINDKIELKLNQDIHIDVF